MNLSRLATGCLAGTVIIFVLVACASNQYDPVSEPTPRQYLEKGRTLVKGLAACGFCHGEKADPSALLIGGRYQVDIYGQVNATNLTPAASGLKNWGVLDFTKLFRSGINREQEYISADLHSGFEWMADGDILAIFAYLKNLPAVENEVERNYPGFIARNTSGVFQSNPNVAGYVPEIDSSNQLEYGLYLTNNVARCSSCHNSPGSIFSDEEYLAGGKTIENAKGEKLAPNITSSQDIGIGTWSEDEIVEFLKSGVGPGNRAADPNFCPVGFYKNALPEELTAIAKYLKSVPPSN